MLRVQSLVTRGGGGAARRAARRDRKQKSKRRNAGAAYGRAVLMIMFTPFLQISGLDTSGITSVRIV